MHFTSFDLENKANLLFSFQTNKKFTTNKKQNANVTIKITTTNRIVSRSLVGQLFFIYKTKKTDTLFTLRTRLQVAKYIPKNFPEVSIVTIGLWFRYNYPYCLLVTSYDNFKVNFHHKPYSIIFKRYLCHFFTDRK